MARLGNSDLVDISGEVRAETERAVQFFDGDKIVWISKSQCEWEENSQTMAMPEWLAKDKGLI